MRERGNCTRCGYLIEHQRMQRSIRPETSQLDAYRYVKAIVQEEWNEQYIPCYKTPPSNTYGREEWYEYYVDEKRVTYCPGCGGALSKETMKG